MTLLDGWIGCQINHRMGFAIWTDIWIALDDAIGSDAQAKAKAELWYPVKAIASYAQFEVACEVICSR